MKKKVYELFLPTAVDEAGVNWLRLWIPLGINLYDMKREKQKKRVDAINSLGLIATV